MSVSLKIVVRFFFKIFGKQYISVEHA